MLKIELTPDGQMTISGQAVLLPQETQLVRETLNIFANGGPITQPVSMVFEPAPRRQVIPFRQVVPRPATDTPAPTPPPPCIEWVRVAPPPIELHPLYHEDLNNLQGTQTLPCSTCGQPKRQSAWQVKRNNGKVYCCRECFQASRGKR